MERNEGREMAETHHPDSLRSRLEYEPVELKFGTSGRRGEVLHLTQLEIYINAIAELEYLQSLPPTEGGIVRGDAFYFAYDLRPSSSRYVASQGGRGEICPGDRARDSRCRNAAGKSRLHSYPRTLTLCDLTSLRQHYDHVAEYLGRELAAAGVAVVSGMARGVDVHLAARSPAAGERSRRGAGPDRVYPPEHAGLAEEIAASGCLLTEYPPGCRRSPITSPSATASSPASPRPLSWSRRTSAWAP